MRFVPAGLALVLADRIPMPSDRIFKISSNDFARLL